MGEQLKPEVSDDILRRHALEEILRESPRKRQIKIGDNITAIEGPHAHKFLTVVGKDAQSTLILEDTTTNERITMPETEVWHFDDYYHAYRRAEEAYPLPGHERRLN